nr:hypothetical protein Ade03nite_14600 [Actinoplanes derwentensis]
MPSGPRVTVARTCPDPSPDRESPNRAETRPVAQSQEASDISWFSTRFRARRNTRVPTAWQIAASCSVSSNRATTLAFPPVRGEGYRVAASAPSHPHPFEPRLAFNLVW